MLMLEDQRALEAAREYVAAQPLADINVTDAELWRDRKSVV